jgi:methionyl-tRNA synthetase
MVSERYLVTAALPYANGPIHIGHAIGCYIPADIFARYHRLRGDDVIYICGTDEHGTPISVTADQEGITPREVVDKYHEKHLEAFKGVGIEFTNFSGTARPIHHELSQDFFKKILDNGYVYEKTVLRPYCKQCNRFLPDRYVRGTCPKCGAEDERGDQCETCSTQLEPHELKNPYCIICRNVPEVTETDHWFFKLSEFSDKLREWIEGNKHWPANARNFSLGWIKEGLEDRAITRDLRWGVPVPVEKAEGKVLYVWFDAPIGYISSTKEWSKEIGREDEWEKYWLEEQTKIVHFIGKDNIPFHAIIWPAMLIAYGGYTLPWQIASNEYLNLEGQKMSTSRGWVLWLHDCLSEFEPDLIRYYLTSITPQSSDSDFSLKEFQERVNNELIATLGNFANRVLTFIKKEGGVVPNPVEFDELDNNLIEFIKKQPDEIAAEIDRFNFITAQSKVLALAQEGNKYFQAKEPWKKKGGNTLYLCANLLRSLSIVMEPFLPYSAEKIWKMLNLKDSVHKQKWEDARELGVKGGQKIGGVKALYKKIEDKQMDEFKKKYLPVAEDETKKEEEKEMVDFEEFNKLDLRVGVVAAADDHPNADKLTVLKVDLGDLGERTLVAGVKENYPKKELVGRQIIVIANLKPAKIRGVESQGMLLAAEDDEGKPILLKPDKNAKPGSKIR